MMFGDKILARDSCHAVIVTFKVKPALLDEFRIAILANASESITLEKGCRLFDVCELTDGTFVLYELYDDEAAFAAHLKTKHFISFDAKSRDWVIEKAVARATRLQNAEPLQMVF